MEAFDTVSHNILPSNFGRYEFDGSESEQKASLYLLLVSQHWCEEASQHENHIRHLTSLWKFLLLKYEMDCSLPAVLGGEGDRAALLAPLLLAIM